MVCHGFLVEHFFLYQCFAKQKKNCKKEEKKNERKREKKETCISI